MVWGRVDLQWTKQHGIGCAKGKTNYFSPAEFWFIAFIISN
jgi:hypothetical protein